MGESILKISTLMCRSVCVVLSGLLFINNAVLSHATETNFWKERSHQQLARLPVSPLESPPLTSFPPVLQKSLINSIAESRTPSLAGVGLIKNIPASWGSIRKISSSPRSSASTPTLLHIQDVHLNAEAQNNISETLQHLIKNKAVDLVALEGTTGLIDFSWTRPVADDEAVENVGSYLLRENLISGATHAAYAQSTHSLPIFVGVDDKAH